MSNNYHRIMWQLSPPVFAPNPNPTSAFFAANFYFANIPNRFWLEPEVYAGPPVIIGQGPAAQTYQPNSLCFRVKFFGAEMTDPWKDCLLFPHPLGVQPLQFAPNNEPDPNPNGLTERLVGLTRANNQAAIVVVYMDVRAQPTELRIVGGAIGQGNHLGAGIAHQ
jgi:hypothetical protein